jgi:hypothetical protein
MFKGQMTVYQLDNDVPTEFKHHIQLHITVAPAVLMARVTSSPCFWAM